MNELNEYNCFFFISYIALLASTLCICYCYFHTFYNFVLFALHLNARLNKNYKQKTKKKKKNQGGFGHYGRIQLTFFQLRRRRHKTQFQGS